MNLQKEEAEEKQRVGHWAHNKSKKVIKDFLTKLVLNIISMS